MGFCAFLSNVMLLDFGVRNVKSLNFPCIYFPLFFCALLMFHVVSFLSFLTDVSVVKKENACVPFTDVCSLKWLNLGYLPKPVAIVR